MRYLPEVFPGAVLVHALSRPFLPATPRRTVDSYWSYHPVRADKLARALAALSGAPEGWVWRAGIQKSEPLVSFRVPPTPFREPAYTKDPGHCCVCALGADASDLPNTAKATPLSGSGVSTPLTQASATRQARCGRFCARSRRTLPIAEVRLQLKHSARTSELFTALGLPGCGKIALR
jgi:hypothetical protein